MIRDFMIKKKIKITMDFLKIFYRDKVKYDSYKVV